MSKNSNLYTFLFSAVLLTFSSCFSGHDDNLIKQQDLLVKQELSKLHSEGNCGATILHAAVKVKATEWIKCWIELNINKPDFKEIIKKRDSFMLTAYQLANYMLSNDIAGCLIDHH